MNLHHVFQWLRTLLGELNHTFPLLDHFTVTVVVWLIFVIDAYKLLSSLLRHKRNCHRNH